MILKIRQTGEPVLRRHARALSREEILSDEIQRLIADMRDTVRDAPGVGLAAPQIGESLRLAVIEDRQEYIDKLPPGQAEDRGRVAVPFHVIVNPVLTLEAEPDTRFFEGCLSVAGFTAIVPRAAKVRVECLNESAQPVAIEAAGWYARILQHEIDHLHGGLYIDRMNSRSFMTLENFIRHGKTFSAGDPKLHRS
jgi:peptide deformylase